MSHAPSIIEQFLQVVTGEMEKAGVPEKPVKINLKTQLEEFTKAKTGDLAHPVYGLHFITMNVGGDPDTDIGLTLHAADVLDDVIHAMAEEIAKLRNKYP